jgi:hypothetical protein
MFFDYTAIVPGRELLRPICVDDADMRRQLFPFLPPLADRQ